MGAALEFRQLTAEWIEPLAEFFAAVATGEGGAYFHPHPLTAAEAGTRCHYRGADLYYVAVAEGHVLGYGMLRGWDEGFDVPSLGIAVHPAYRGTGIANALMLFLHAAAKLRGAERVRLSVHPDNARALALYRDLGYQFCQSDAERLIGTAQL